MAKGTNYTLYTSVQLDAGNALKAGKEIRKMYRSVKEEMEKQKALYKTMQAESDKYTSKEIDAQKKRVDNLSKMTKAQKQALDQQITDLNMLRKATENLDKMSLRQLNEALNQAKKKMRQLGGDKHSQEELQGTKELMTMIETRIKSINIGFKDAFEAAKKGAKMSMPAMQDLIKLLDMEAAALAKNDKQYKEMMELSQKLKSDLAGRKGFNEMNKAFATGKGSSVTDAQLKEYKKFCEGVANSAMSSAKQVKEAQIKIDEVNRELDKRAKGGIEEQGKRIIKATNSTEGFKGTISETKEAITQLEKFRGTLKTTDAGKIKEVDSAIEKLKADIAKVNETVTAGENLMKNFSISNKNAEQLEKMKATLEAYKRTLKSTDTTGLIKVRKNIEEIDKAQNKLNADSYNWKEFLDGIHGKSLNELKRAYEVLRKEVSSMSASQGDYNEKAAQMRKIDSQIKRLTRSMGEHTSSIENAVSRLRNYVAIYLGFNQLMMKAQQAWHNIVELSDQMTNVQKVTGMAADEIERMTNAVQNLDTRTDNKTLMELAEQAGKLGYNTADAITQFVSAGQVITNTLGDIGGAESITELLKISDLVNKDKGLTIEESLNRIGSAVLNIGNNSKSSYAEVVDFTKRMGAIGAQSKLTMSQIMALAGTFGALGGNVEASSTAMQRVIMGLQTNTAKVAQATNTSLEDLNRMLSPDGNGIVHTFDALKLVLENIKGQGVQGINDLLQAIGGRNNTQAKAALSLLVGNLDTLDRQLMLAEIGYQDGTLATKEFEKANNNLAGTMAQISNEFYEMGANASASTGAIATLAKWLLNVVRGFKNLHGPITLFSFAVAALTGYLLKQVVAFGANMVAMYKHGLAMRETNGLFSNVILMVTRLTQGLWYSTKALNGNEIAARKATVAWNEFKRVSTWGNWITLLATAIASVVFFVKNLSDETKSAAKAMGEIKEAATKETSALETLTYAIKKATSSQEERKVAIEEFNSKFGDYLSNILTEENYVNRLAIAYNEAASAIAKKTAAEIESNAETKSLEKYGDKLSVSSGNLDNIINTYAVRTQYFSGTSKQLGKMDERGTGSNALKAYIRKLVTEDTNATASTITRKVQEQFKNDTRLSSASYDANGKFFRGESILSNSHVVNAIEDYVDVVKKQVSMANSQRREAGVYRETANMYEGNTFDELMALVGRSSTSDYDKKKAYEQMFKIYEGLNGNERERRRVTNYNNVAKYNQLLHDMKPWGENSGDWTNMGGEDLAAVVDWYNNVQKKYKDGVIDGRNFMKTFGAATPKGVVLPESISNWNGQNLKDWAYSNWKAAQDALDKYNYANGEGNFKDPKKGADRMLKELMDATMKRLDEYYKREEERINTLNLTEAEASRQLLANEKEHLEERINLQEKWFDKTKKFNHDYITELFNDIKDSDWQKVNNFLGLRENMGDAQGVRLNMAKDANKIQTDRKAMEQKRYNVLKGEDSFSKIFESFTKDLDVLNLILPGMSKDENGGYTNLEGEIHERMSFIYKIMGEASKLNAEQLKSKMADAGLGSWLLDDSQIELLRNRMVKFNDTYEKELRKQANDIKKQLDERNAENGIEEIYTSAEGTLSRRGNLMGMWDTATQGSNVFGISGADQAVLDMYDLKIKKSQDYIEQIKAEMATRLLNAKDEEEKARLQREQEYLIANARKDIAKNMQESADKQAELAFKQIEKFRPYADMVNQFAEDFGANIFGKKEDREKAAKELLTSFIKTTGMMLAEHLSYLATKQMADRAADAQEVDAEGKKSILALILGGAKGTAAEVGKLGWAGFAVGAAITAAMTGLIAYITSQINKTKSELGVSTGKLSTEMLTYADGYYPTHADGTVGGMTKVNGADGQTYNATYKPNLTTGEYNRPHLGIVGEKGAELIIDHNTYMGLKKHAPYVLKDIYDMHRYGRLGLDYPALTRSASMLNGTRVTVSRGVRTYANGNIEDVISGISPTATDAPTNTQSTNDRLADVLERLMANGIQAKVNMYGKGELYDSLQKADKFMRGKSF